MMSFRIADTFTDSLARLTGAAQLVEIRETVKEIMVSVYVGSEAQLHRACAAVTVSGLL